MPTRRKDDPARARKAFASVVDQLAELKAMTVAGLRARYEEVFGEPSRSRNKDYLRKKIAYRIQEMAEGGLSDRARARIEELATDAPVRWRASSKGNGSAGGDGAAPPVVAETTTRDPRLPPPGTVITRALDGVEHKVTVLEDGFEYRGSRYPTLSAIARVISGTNWNGFLFFRLQRRSRTSGGQG